MRKGIKQVWRYLRDASVVSVVVSPVGTSQEELAERWPGPEGILERAGGWRPEPAAEKEIRRKDGQTRWTARKRWQTKKKRGKQDEGDRSEESRGWQQKRQKEDMMRTFS